MNFFFAKNVSRPSNPPDELAQNVSKKNPFRTNYSSIFSAKVQNLAVFSFIYMIRIRFFGPQELIQKYFRRAQYSTRGGSNIFQLFDTEEKRTTSWQTKKALVRAQRSEGRRARKLGKMSGTATSIKEFWQQPLLALRRPWEQIRIRFSASWIFLTIRIFGVFGVQSHAM